MRIAVSSTGSSLESDVDFKFGRAAFFIIIDPATMEYESLENSAAGAFGGAGVMSAQLVIGKDINAIISGNVGPNALNVLRSGNVDIYRANQSSVKDNIAKYKEGLLEKIDTPVNRHFGMRR